MPMIAMGVCPYGERKEREKHRCCHFMKMYLGSRLAQLASNDGSWLDLSPCSVALTGIFFDTIMSACHGTEMNFKTLQCVQRQLAGVDDCSLSL